MLEGTALWLALIVALISAAVSIWTYIHYARLFWALGDLIEFEGKVFSDMAEAVRESFVAAKTHGDSVRSALESNAAAIAILKEFFERPVFRNCSGERE